MMSNQRQNDTKSTVNRNVTALYKSGWEQNNLSNAIEDSS